LIGGSFLLFDIFLVFCYIYNYQKLQIRCAWFFFSYAVDLVAEGVLYIMGNLYSIWVSFQPWLWYVKIDDDA
jgi:hypothetical protein